MATVTVTTAYSYAGGTQFTFVPPFAQTHVGGTDVWGASQYPVGNVYHVAIELSVGDISLGSFGKIRETPFTYPLYDKLFPYNGKTQPSTFYNDGAAAKLIAAKLTGIPGKAVLYGAGGLVEDTGGGELSLYGYPTIQAGDVGCPCGVFIKYTGASTNISGSNCPSFDFYFFFINIDPVENNLADISNLFTLTSVGINNATLNSIFGSDVMGVHLTLGGINPGNQYYGIGISIVPSYKTSLNGVKHNANIRPGISRATTFSSDTYPSPQSWMKIKTSGASVVTGAVKAPFGTNLIGQSTGFVIGGAPYTLLIAPNTGTGEDINNISLKIYYYNVFGKCTNPSGTILSATAYPGSSPYEGDSFMAGTFTPPADTFSYRITAIATVADPGVEHPATGFVEMITPPKYASEQGDFVPGNHYEYTLGESDMP